MLFSATVGKRLPRIALAAAAISLLAACGSSSDTSTTADRRAKAEASRAVKAAERKIKPPAGLVDFAHPAPGSGKGLTLGYISLGDSIPFVRVVTQSMRREAKIAGANLLVCDAALDAQKALACARDFKTRGVQAYLNFQFDTKAAPGICAAGPQVPVIAVDVRQPPCEGHFMGVNNYYAGTFTGVAMGNFAKAKWQCKIDAYITLMSVNDTVVLGKRAAGNRDGFKSICPNDPPIVRQYDAITEDQGRKTIADLLTTLPGKDRIVVMAMNDAPIIGAIAAAKAVGRSGDVWYTAQGGDYTSHCEVLNNPQWVAETGYFPEKYGQIGIPALIKAAKGEKVPQDLIVKVQALTKESLPEHYHPKC